MIRELGRWLFGIPGVRKSALILLYPFPSLRRLLRIFVGVEGGMTKHYIDQSAPELLAPRASSIFADLTQAKSKHKKDLP